MPDPSLPSSFDGAESQPMAITNSPPRLAAIPDPPGSSRVQHPHISCVSVPAFFQVFCCSDPINVNESCETKPPSIAPKMAPLFPRNIQQYIFPQLKFPVLKKIISISLPFALPLFSPNTITK